MLSIDGTNITMDLSSGDLLGLGGAIISNIFLGTTTGLGEGEEEDPDEARILAMDCLFT